MIWTFEVHDLELKAFDSAVLLGAEQDIDPQCAHGCTRDTRHNTMEGSPAWLQHILSKAHLVHIPLSMRTRVNLVLMAGPMNVGSTTRAYPLGLGMTLGWSSRLQLISCSDQFMNLGTAGMTAFTSIARQIGRAHV